MKKLIVSYERFTVLKVPFPFTDRTAAKNRPALVLSDAATFNDPIGHSVLAMITSAANPAWPLDCLIDDLVSAGLPAPSVVRFKLFTLDHRLIRGELGRLAVSDSIQVTRSLYQLFGMTAVR
ncbi:MAG TPA: type II toxin-antitoxin system PemK/MazF family toxin [Nitrosomonas europaea]|uniref:type II toxin-antitoxin system PemK/MazF family toxin n=1 Tax=Nitrosomonas europaea TaxID=915 RepID=UPI002B54E02B|nr:type II toxin-antitoxin system PemK/MazF family toxin [Nitrosomonas europaea]HUM72962.1 type II toxin-antitoxin system PemK/MazF family toxin [Nitrosomonas europaea]